MKLLNVIILRYLQITLVYGEVLEIPNLALYHVTPVNDAQVRFINRLRTSDTGMYFINGVGIAGETVELLASPEIMEFFDKEMDELKLDYDMKFHPVTIEMFNNHSDKEAGAQTQHIINLPVKRKFMAIEPIVPPIYSGVFLRISSSIYPDVDYLSISQKMNSSMGNPILCFSVNKTNKHNDPKKQWMFEKTEYEGYYALRNRKIPLGFVTWEDDDEPMLVIETRLEFQRQFREGGHYRKNVLFKITPATVDDDHPAPDNGPFYGLKIMGEDDEDTEVVLDVHWEHQTGCYILHRTYPEAARERSDFHLKIEIPDSALKVEGHLEDFTYKETVNELFDKAQKKGFIKTITTRQIYNHGDEAIHVDIEDIHERIDKFHLKFSTPMDAFQILRVPPGLSIGTPATSYNKEEIDSIKLQRTPGKETLAKVKYLITGGIQVPPWSAAEYAVVFGWLKNAEMDFDAKLKIFGRADRMLAARNPKVITGQYVDFSWVKEVLKGRGFEIDPSKNIDPNGTEFEMAIKGKLYAWTLGIKGEVELTIDKLSSEVNSTCHHNHEHHI